MPFRPIKEVIRDQHLLHAPPTMTVSEAAALMKKRHVGALLVMKRQELAGIFTERDAVFRVLATHANPDHTQLDEVMTPAPQTIAADRPLSHALHIMYEGGFRHVPVVENGKLVGMVSARDALSSELAQFESDMVEREHIAEILG
ncbi:MAG: CBS domain-containing protein [Burkholderiales bacterium]